MYLTETGYPSEGCNASPEGQREFVEIALTAWQAHKSSMPLLELVWLNDISDGELAGYKRYYGFSNKCFLSYLSNLGLRNRDGSAKPALTYLLNR